MGSGLNVESEGVRGLPDEVREVQESIAIPLRGPHMFPSLPSPSSNVGDGGFRNPAPSLSPGSIGESPLNPFDGRVLSFELHSHFFALSTAT